MTQQKTRGDTANSILAAAKRALLDVGYAGLSTRAIADEAGVPLSQIHYHFGSKQKLVLAILERENQRLLDRQERMFASSQPLWKQWEQACDFLDDDLASGYVRVLQEMIAAGWADPELAQAVWAQLEGWHSLLASVGQRAELELRPTGVFDPLDIATLASALFVGTEAVILLGVGDERFPIRASLRKIGVAIRVMEERGTDEG
jgi:AcrR family transcriptional regulator